MKRGMKIVAVLALLFLVFSVAYPFLGSFLVPFWQSPDLGEAARFTSVEVEMIDWRATPDLRSTFASSQDTKAIATLVGVIEAGKRIDDCRCLRSGFVRMTDKDGDTLVIQLVPGHGVDTFDIRYDGRRYSINRSALRDALESVGAVLPEYNKPDGQGP